MPALERTVVLSTTSVSAAINSSTALPISSSSFCHISACISTITTTTNVAAPSQQRRGLSYNPYDSIMKKNAGGVGKYTKPDTLQTGGTAHSIGGGKRMTESQRKKEERIILPTTLPSGRFEQKHTTAQTIYNRESRGKPEDPYSKPPDSRYYQDASDYRQIKDTDPYAELFGESKTTSRVRIRFWQKQFEEENKDTWLPYERTNAFLRALPNWPVRYLVKLRDMGGYQTPLPMFVWLFVTLGGGGSYTYFFLMRPSEVSDDVGDLR